MQEQIVQRSINEVCVCAVVEATIIQRTIKCNACEHGQYLTPPTKNRSSPGVTAVPPWCVATVAPPSPGALAQLATVRLGYGALRHDVRMQWILGPSGAEGIFTLWLCQNSYWKSPFLMGKSTISMVIFNSYMLNYQRVSGDWDLVSVVFFGWNLSWLGLFK